MMKAYGLLMTVTLLAAASMMVITGCEYDVAQPQWDKDYQAPPTPRITQVDPAQAAPPGANTITIHGENFAAAPGANVVYAGNAVVGNVIAEIVESSATSITVRRPNLVTDACTLKVVPSNALLVAKFGPYKIDPVLERYGDFRSNVQLSTIAVDNAENLYVVEATTRNVVRVTPTGEKSTLARFFRTPTDINISPTGKLVVLTGASRRLYRMDLASGAVDSSAVNRSVRVGGFDPAGYMYAGGARTDLAVITLEPQFSIQPAGFYASDEILVVRVYSGYVYVASRANAQSPAAIWRHSIGAGGSVGAKELVLDMNTTGFASRTITGIAFSANGTMFLGADSSDPFLIVDPATKRVDFFYKSILPPYCKQVYWGTGNYLYTISGNVNPAQEWTVFRVDMGTTGAPYFGG
jgi:hypothetical protein